MNTGNRISTTFQFDLYMSDMRRTQEAYLSAQRRVSSGKKFQTAAEDPLGFSTAMNLRAARSAIGQYSANIKSGKGILSYSEAALGDTNDLVREGYQLALSGANAATDQTSRNAMVDQVTELQRRLVELANSRGPSGQFIFAGQKNDAPPFAVNGGALTYSGDNNNIQVEVDATTTMTVNTQGQPLFSDIYARLETLKTALMGGDTGTLQGICIDDMQRSQRDIGAARGQAGAKLQSIETMDAQFTRRKDELTTGISDVEDVDMAEAILTYKQAESAYTAAMQVASQGFGLSLLNFIRT